MIGTSPAPEIPVVQSTRWTASRRASLLLLSGLLGTALALRFWGVSFGLPYLYHYDEHFYVNTALKLGTGVLNNAPFAPTGYSNLLFLEYAVYFVIGRLLGPFSSAAAFEAQFRGDPSAFYLIARSTTALFGTKNAIGTSGTA